MTQRDENEPGVSAIPGRDRSLDTERDTETMIAERRCWWCGRTAEADTSAIRSNGLLRDDSTMDGSESWICEQPCEWRGGRTVSFDGPFPYSRVITPEEIAEAERLQAAVPPPEPYKFFSLSDQVEIYLGPDGGDDVCVIPACGCDGRPHP